MSNKNANNNKLKNKVIIIGGDHHNTLAVIRNLGRNKVLTHVLIHVNSSKLDDICVAKSKYTMDIDLVEDDESAIIKWLKAYGINEFSKEKMILFPCSDLAAYTIDMHHRELSEWYIIPGFKDNPGYVGYMMNKYNQKLWAEKNNIPMAKTWNLHIKDNCVIPDDMEYPCIIKPNISAFGCKGDIVICKGVKELEDSINKYRVLGYESVLVQKFLRKKYEVCTFGCILYKHRSLRGGYKNSENQ